MVIIGQWSSKSTFGANKRNPLINPPNLQFFKRRSHSRTIRIPIEVKVLVYEVSIYLFKGVPYFTHWFKQTTFNCLYIQEKLLCWNIHSYTEAPSPSIAATCQAPLLTATRNTQKGKKFELCHKLLYKAIFWSRRTFGLIEDDLEKHTSSRWVCHFLLMPPSHWVEVHYHSICVSFVIPKFSINLYPL